MARTKTSRTTTKSRKTTAKKPTRSAKTANRAAAAATKGGKKARTTRAPRKATSRVAAAGDREVTIDRRRGDAPTSAADASKTSTAAAAPKLERRKKVNRRRQIDPTTCERDYTDGEVEFMNAIDDYKRKSGRMFPTCSEVLEVVRSLGYVKLANAPTSTKYDFEKATPPASETLEAVESDAELLAGTAS